MIIEKNPAGENLFILEISPNDLKRPLVMEAALSQFIIQYGESKLSKVYAPHYVVLGPKASALLHRIKLMMVDGTLFLPYVSE